MNIELGKDWEAFVEEQINLGRYRTVDEVIREGLRLLKVDCSPDERRRAFFAGIEEGLDDIRRGDFDRVAREQLAEYGEQIKALGRQRLTR